MSHTIRRKKPLRARVARIRGQLEAVDRALEGEAECREVLRLIASARGAMNGLMSEILEEHIRMHSLRPGRTPADAEAADDVIAVVRSYLR